MSFEVGDERTDVALEAHAPADVPGLVLDREYGAIPLAGLVPRVVEDHVFDVGEAEAVDASPAKSTYLVRGTVDSSAITDQGVRIQAPNVVNVWADTRIEVCTICPGSPALGTDADVAALLDVPGLAKNHMDGNGVLVAIVDTGVNLAYLRSKGKTPGFDASRSWVPRAGLVPGELPVGHGTMCAYDVLIAAPRCTLLDVAVLRSTQQGGSVMDGLLSDAVRAYAHLLRILLTPKRPGENRSMVVNNSWGMFHPSWDFPLGHPGRYSDNPAHPFNRIVGSLERAGADILFAAGNCGRECPDGRCRRVTNAGIFGANSHPQVLCIAGVDVQKNRVGYSTSGPGLLGRIKPDLSSYTHFAGSGVYGADGGTSAATPVAAGVLAAFRSRFPYNVHRPVTHPAAVRTLLTRTAEDRGAVGFDFDYGWGIINGRRLAKLRSLEAREPIGRELAAGAEAPEVPVEAPPPAPMPVEEAEPVAPAEQRPAA
ncbi:MAG TPA: S8 family serine peptidase [Anaeromyxobacteraceae bacterium]|nr:S8 family serine peptidase [Anaeromyxobacteraceae bacterium]